MTTNRTGTVKSWIAGNEDLLDTGVFTTRLEKLDRVF
jgi:hypothetical protein